MKEQEQWTKSYSLFIKTMEKFTLENSNFDKPLHEVEGLLFDEIMEMGRQLFQEHIDARGNGDVGKAIIREDGRKLSHRREGNFIQTTHFGKVAVKPQGYGFPGESQIFPLKGELSLPDQSFSYPIQKKVCFEAIKGPYEHVTKTLDEYTKAHVPKQQAQHIVDKVATDFDAVYAKTCQEPKASNTEIVVATADGKGVVMRKEDLREATRKRAQSKKKKHRRSKGEKSNRKRMATVASVYNVASHKRKVDDVVNEMDRKASNERRPRPEEKRVWASVEKDPREVFDEITNEVLSRLDMNKIVVFLSDGEKNLKQLAKTVLKKHVTGNCKEFVMVVDIIHVIEYIWKAGHAFYKENDPNLEIFVQRNIRNILEGKAGLVAGAIGRTATKAKIEGDKLIVIKKIVTYLKNNKAFMRYDKCLEMGLPIATGVIEGACKSLVKDRFEVTGARWSLDGAESLLKLRAIYQSNDWDEYMEFHIKQEQDRLYPKGHWAPLTKNGKPELKVVSGGIKRRKN